MKVFIDPGHGGYDPGATGNGHKESDLVLEDALAVGAMLIKAGVQVKFSRTKDVFVGLHQRAIEANVWGADLFTSFHINSAAAKSATGSETWHHHEHSRELAEKLQQALTQTLSLANRGVKQKGFVVVKNPRMPAALMEPFFIGNSHDLNRYLERREQLQVNIAKAILDYLGVEPAPERMDTTMVQPRRKHHQTIVPSDTALHIKNTHTTLPIKVTLRRYDKFGKLENKRTQRIVAGRIYSIPFNSQFCSYVLRSLAKFTSRVE